MKKKILLIIIISAVILSGCKSLFTREGNLLSDAINAKSRGDYQASVLNVVESVRIDNEYADAIMFLQKTYPEANSYYSQKIEERKSANGKFTNDEIVKYFQYLQTINESVKTLPMLYDPQTKEQLSFSYTDYRSELERYNEFAAEDHYQEGIRLMKLKGRENARNASREFDTALSYVAGYKDAVKRAEKSLEDATQVIAFFPFQNNAWNIPTDKFSDLIQNAAISRLLGDKEVMKFTKIIDRGMQENLMAEQIESMSSLMDDKSRVEIGQLLNSNIFLTGSIEASELIGPSTTMNQYHRKSTIEVVQEVLASPYKSDGSEEEDPYKSSETTTQISYKDIHADVYHYTKFIRFNVTITYKAVDVETGAILLSNTINIEETDSSEWAEWSGDNGALRGEDWSLINSHESIVKTPQQLASAAATSIGGTLADELKTILK
ncbi:MAG: hypothetical protein JEZ04_06285 [Spirochaetales bacterium]|nr:hypothetical protein [Spirochaetales bacterium]